MNIKTVTVKRSQNLKTFLIVLALAISSLVAIPSIAQASGGYDGTSGQVACGTSGYFTVSSNVVTSNSSCVGSVAIPNGVTRIGNGALAGVSNLSSITISNTVTTIEDNAFSQLGYVSFDQNSHDYGSDNNATITSLVIPDTVTSIGVRAFYGLTTITSLTLPNNITTIPQEAFFGMSNLLSLTIPNSVTSIGPSSFYIMSHLTSLTISENISTIPDQAFAGMYAIQTINIPNNVTSIGYEAFSYPRGLRTLNLGTGLTSIGAHAFIGPLSLTAIVIPNSVTTIGDSAFSMDWVNVLSSITIGNNVVSIGDSAFAGADGVTSLTLPSSVSFIGTNAFSGHASSFTFNYCGNASLVNTGLPDPATNAASCAPAPPTNLTANTTNATANISFTEGATFGVAITNYEYSLNNGAFTAFSPVDTTTPVSITGLTNGTTYSIRLRGVNARGTGAASTPISVTIPATALTPTFGTVAATSDGFTAQITNYSPSYTWAGTATASGSVTVDGAGLLTVTGVAAGTSSTATITATRTGYFTGSATVSGTSTSTSCSPSQTVSGNYTISTFSTAGTCDWVVPLGITSVEVLVVGGGGGGASNYLPWNAAGGAGGGGGAYSANGVPVTASSTISISVGAGGTAGPYLDASLQGVGSQGGRGGTSSFGTITAGGGGGGGCLSGSQGGSCDAGQTQDGGDGTAGGAGGGSSNFYNAYTYGRGGISTSVTIGGVTFDSQTSYIGAYPDFAPAQGGAAGPGGGARGNATQYIPGEGLNSSITGTSVVYGAGGTAYGATGATFRSSTSGYGTGGDGAFKNGPASGGATGARGVVVVKYFLPPAAPAFSLSSTSETVTRGIAITGYTITSTGGTIASYSISPAISNTPGLAFDTTTGLISGTPTTTATARTYTITATNVTSPSATRTFSITVLDPPPSISIGTTSFNTASTSNLNVSLYDFDSTQNYQVTVKFVNASTNIEVSNGTLAATQGATRLISGYTSYSGTKIGFTGTYASIAAALATLTWTPASITNGISIRIGISSAPSTNEFYDANSGHYYRFMSTARTWLDARTVAEASYLYGLRGYLAEINTAAENNYIAKETSAKNIWIGAREDDTTTASWRTTSYNGSPGQRWIWNGAIQTPLPIGTGLIAQGTPAAFSSWSANEPNNDTKPGADCAVTNWGTNGLWNDLPCRNGYSFLIEFGGRPNEISTASAATLTETVTATNPILYTITYAPNNGNSTPTQASTSRGQSFTLANAITRSPSGGISYQFASWDNGSNSYRAGDTFTVGTSNLTFTAAWIQLYEVTYIPNGGTFAGGDTNKDSECPLTICSNGQVITLNSAPTRTGYNFAGWKDQSGNFVTDTNSGTAGIQTTVSSTNYIFSAAWTVITYGVTYVSSGSAAPTQLALSTQETFTVGSDVTKAGYRFDGWSDGTYMWWSGDTYVMGTSDVTLTAQWTPIYSVTYSEGSGTGTPPVDTSIHLQGSTVEVPDDSGISKAGFTFGGWSDGSSVVQAGAFYLIGTSDVVLTAVWSSPQSAPRTTTPMTPTTTPKVWIITFDRNGADLGYLPNYIRVVANSDKKIDLPGNIGGNTYKRPLSKRGYVFTGWSTTNVNQEVLPLSLVVTRDMTLYAVWKLSPSSTPSRKPSATTNAQPSNVMVKVGTFYMASGSYFLNDATKSGLRTLAETINASGVKSILVYGHADSKGGVDNNVLSQNRAKAVARFIRPLLNSKKISIGWFSSNKPVSTGKTPADLALNRRVEIYTR